MRREGTGIPVVLSPLLERVIYGEDCSKNCQLYLD
jgi:hypothetical protein